jgi:hypothetical protein
MNLKGLPEPAFLATPKGHAILMLIKVFLLALDVACLAAVVGLHKVVDLLSGWVIPPEWTAIRQFLAATFACAFALIYVHFAFDMVLIFVPWLRGKPKPNGEQPSPSKTPDSADKHIIKKGRGK